MLVIVNNGKCTSLPSHAVATYGNNKPKKPGDVRVKSILTPDRYVFRKAPIASGGSAKVFVGLDPDSGENFAVKQVALAHKNSNSHKRNLLSATRIHKLKLSVSRELNVGDHVASRFGIVRAVTNLKKSRVYIVQHLLSGQVSRLINAIPQAQIPRSDLAIYFAYETAKDYNRLQKNNVLHFDLKPDNICYHVATRRVQIIDFGCSALGDQGFPGGSSEGYATPEHAAGVLCDHRDDIFSLGTTFCEVALGIKYLGDLIPVTTTITRGTHSKDRHSTIGARAHDLRRFQRGDVTSEEMATHFASYRTRLFEQPAAWAQLCLDMTNTIDHENLNIEEVLMRLKPLRDGLASLPAIEALWGTLPAYDAVITDHINRLNAELAQIRGKNLPMIS